MKAVMLAAGVGARLADPSASNSLSKMWFEATAFEAVNGYQKRMRSMLILKRRNSNPPLPQTRQLELVVV